MYNHCSDEEDNVTFKKNGLKANLAKKMNTDWSAVFTNIDPFALASIGASSALFLCVSLIFFGQFSFPLHLFNL